MAHSKTIAGLLGPSLIALAAALLINLGSMSALVEAVSRDPAIVLVSGVLAFAAGLAVVRVYKKTQKFVFRSARAKSVFVSAQPRPKAD